LRGSTPDIVAKAADPRQQPIIQAVQGFIVPFKQLIEQRIAVCIKAGAIHLVEVAENQVGAVLFQVKTLFQPLQPAFAFCRQLRADQGQPFIQRFAGAAFHARYHRSLVSVEVHRVLDWEKEAASVAVSLHLLDCFAASAAASCSTLWL
jgi:hypothetical protein